MLIGTKIIVLERLGKKIAGKKNAKQKKNILLECLWI